MRIVDVLSDKITGEWGVEPVNGNGVAVLRTTNFTNIGKIDYSNIIYREIDVKKINQKKLKKGDIIIEKSGGSPSQPVGRVVFFETESSDVFICNNFTAILRPNFQKVFPKYLFYQLFFGYKRGKTLKYQNKTTGIINLKLDNYLNEKIQIPETFNDQIKIVQLLSQAEALIAKRKQGIALLEEFLKSTFLEMFGDYKKMSSSEIEQLGNNISFLTSGSRGWAKYHSEKGAKFLRIQNIGNGLIRTDNLIYINTPDSLEAKRTRVQEGDLIISITADLGRTSVIPANFGEAYINQHLALIRLNKNINPMYAAYFYNMPFGNNAIQQKNRAAVKAGLNFKDIKSFPILIPPIELQNQFAHTVEKIEVIKTKCQRSLEELERLFGALSQQAFKGELDLSKIQLHDDQEYSVTENDRIEPKPIENIKTEKKPKQDNKNMPAKKALWVMKSVLGKPQNIPFNEAEGNAVFKKRFSKIAKGFGFDEFETFIKTEGFTYEYHQLRDFIFEKLENKELVQFYSNKEWRETNYKNATNPFQDDFAGDGKIYLVPNEIKK